MSWGGVAVKEVARQYRVRESTIYHWIRKHKSKFDNSDRKKFFLSESEWKDIVNEWENSGETQTEFAKRKGISNYTLSKWVNRFKKEENKEEKETDDMSLLVLQQKENEKLKKENEALTMTIEIYKRELEQLKPLGEGIKKLYENYLK